MTEHHPEMPDGYEDTKSLLHAARNGDDEGLDAMLASMSVSEMRDALRYSAQNMAYFYAKGGNPDYIEVQTRKYVLSHLKSVRALFAPVWEDARSIADARTRRERAEYSGKVVLAIRETDAYIRDVEAIVRNLERHVAVPNQEG